VLYLAQSSSGRGSNDGRSSRSRAEGLCNQSEALQAKQGATERGSEVCASQAPLDLLAKLALSSQIQLERRRLLDPTATSITTTTGTSHIQQNGTATPYASSRIELLNLETSAGRAQEMEKTCDEETGEYRAGGAKNND